MKFKSICWLVAVICLAACSRGDDLPLVASVDGGDEDNYVPQVSDIPIRFAPVDLVDVIGSDYQTNGSTRGSSTESGYSQDSVGIFCLAKYSIEGLTAIHTPTWSGKSKSKLQNTYSVWQKNLLASITSTSNPEAGSLRWANNYKDEFNFYPASDWYAYGFFAYYPYTNNIVFTQKTITALIKTDGDDDVCYAMAAAPKTPTPPINDTYAAIYRKGFSRSYYEAIAGHDPGVDEWIYPQFKFNRLVSRVKFLFRMTEEPKYNLHVDKVEVVNFPCLMKVGVSRSSGDMKLNEFNYSYIYKESELGDYINKISATTNLDSLQVVEAYPELRSMLGNYVLKETNGESISGQKNADGSYKYNLTTEKQQVGGYLMIPPVTDGHPTLSKMQVFVTLCDDAGNRYINKKKLVIDPPTGGYKIGKTHTHTIVLSNLIPTVTNSEIGEWDAEELGSINETLTQWERLP